MKITVTRLKEIIKEEVTSFVAQDVPQAPLEEAVDVKSIQMMMKKIGQSTTAALGNLESGDLDTLYQSLAGAVAVLSKV